MKRGAAMKKSFATIMIVARNEYAYSGNKNEHILKSDKRFSLTLFSEYVIMS